MPLARYFLFVGGVLLALLFMADAYLPKQPVRERANGDLPVIRIHSDRKWPERVVYDTNLPTIIPAQTASNDAGVAPPEPVAGVSAREPLREAFAQMQPSDAAQLQPSELKKPGPAPHHKRKIARKHVEPRMLLVARHPSLGWFGNIW